MDRRLHTPRWISQGGGRRLALTVLRAEIALVYLASGFSKLIDSDWWGGTVTRLRIVANLEHLQSLPDAVVDLLLDPGFHTWAAKVTILTEPVHRGGSALAEDPPDRRVGGDRIPPRHPGNRRGASVFVGSVGCPRRVGPTSHTTPAARPQRLRFPPRGGTTAVNEQTPTTPLWQTRKFRIGALITVIAALMLTLILQNFDTTEVQFFFWRAEAPLPE